LEVLPPQRDLAKRKKKREKRRGGEARARLARTGEWTGKWGKVSLSGGQKDVCVQVKKQGKGKVKDHQ